MDSGFVGRYPPLCFWMNQYTKGNDISLLFSHLCQILLSRVVRFLLQKQPHRRVAQESALQTWPNSTFIELLGHLTEAEKEKIYRLDQAYWQGTRNCSNNKAAARCFCAWQAAQFFTNIYDFIITFYKIFEEDAENALLRNSSFTTKFVSEKNQRQEPDS